MSLRIRLALVAGLLSLVLLTSAQADAGGLPAWGIEQAAKVGGGGNAISVRAHDDIWAVGYSNGEVNSRTLTMHFDGSAWTVVPSPNLPDGNRLADVVARSPTDACAADRAAPNDGGGAGLYWDAQTHAHSVILHWDGKVWRRAPLGAPSLSVVAPRRQCDSRTGLAG